LLALPAGQRNQDWRKSLNFDERLCSETIDVQLSLAARNSERSFLTEATPLAST
jgi:hypothetical protein